MANIDTRVEALLNSLVGCEFLVTLVESGIVAGILGRPEGQPMVSGRVRRLR